MLLFNIYSPSTVQLQVHMLEYLFAGIVSFQQQSNCHWKKYHVRPLHITPPCTLVIFHRVALVTTFISLLWYCNIDSVLSCAYATNFSFKYSIVSLTSFQHL